MSTAWFYVADMTADEW